MAFITIFSVQTILCITLLIIFIFFFQQAENAFRNLFWQQYGRFIRWRERHRRERGQSTAASDSQHAQELDNLRRKWQSRLSIITIAVAMFWATYAMATLVLAVRYAQVSACTSHFMRRHVILPWTPMCEVRGIGAPAAFVGNFSGQEPVPEVPESVRAFMVTPIAMQDSVDKLLQGTRWVKVELNDKKLLSSMGEWDLLFEQRAYADLHTRPEHLMHTLKDYLPAVDRLVATTGMELDRTGHTLRVFASHFEAYSSSPSYHEDGAWRLIDFVFPQYRIWGHVQRFMGWADGDAIITSQWQRSAEMRYLLDNFLSESQTSLNVLAQEFRQTIHATYLTTIRELGRTTKKALMDAQAKLAMEDKHIIGNASYLVRGAMMVGHVPEASRRIHNIIATLNYTTDAIDRTDHYFQLAPSIYKRLSIRLELLARLFRHDLDVDDVVVSSSSATILSRSCSYDDIDPIILLALDTPSINPQSPFPELIRTLEPMDARHRVICLITQYWQLLNDVNPLAVGGQGITWAEQINIAQQAYSVERGLTVDDTMDTLMKMALAYAIKEKAENETRDKEAAAKVKEQAKKGRPGKVKQEL